jgi:hypothetical protein|eukprot:SAG25_NODE_58_length_18473_cov_99.552846_13_plen_69_part_00
MRSSLVDLTCQQNTQNPTTLRDPITAIFAQLRSFLLPALIDPASPAARSIRLAAAQTETGMRRCCDVC